MCQCFFTALIKSVYSHLSCRQYLLACCIERHTNIYYSILDNQQQFIHKCNSFPILVTAVVTTYVVSQEKINICIVFVFFYLTSLTPSATTPWPGTHSTNSRRTKQFLSRPCGL